MALPSNGVERVKALLQDVKRATFTDPSKASDADAFGILLANYFQWSGQPIFEAARAAFEDANYHTFNEAFQAAWEAEQARVSGVPAPPLPSTVDTPEVAERVLAAARAVLFLKQPRAVFEHGQWWVTCGVTGAQWSVHDALGPGSSGGFAFEKVTEGASA